MIQDSDVFVYENENMETWVPNLWNPWRDKKTKVIDATKGMVLLPGLEEEHEHEGAKNTIMNMILTYGSHHIVPWRW